MSPTSDDAFKTPLPSPMCGSRKATLAEDPKPRTPTRQRSATPSNPTPSTSAGANVRYSATNSSSLPAAAAASHSSTSSSSTASLSSQLRLSLSLLPQSHPTIYPFTEIAAATNNFLSKRLSSSSSSSAWRCSLRSVDVVIFQRPFRGDPAALPSRLSALCKSHHSSLVRLLGASLGGGNYIYLVYEHVAGAANLRDCLHNTRNPNFTPLSRWLSRMQVATDLAEGLDYIHRHCRTIHDRIKSSSVLVTEPKFNAKICHFGAADLTGVIPEVSDEKVKDDGEDDEKVKGDGEDTEDDEIENEISIETAPAASPRVYLRSDSRRMQIEGTRGYIAPEVIAGGRISSRSDVFAFGVVILELLSGREPLKYTMNPETRDYERISLIETAREAIGGEEEEEEGEAAEERRGRVRRWVDRRLRDSFPLEGAERVMRVALRCVEEAAFMRPDMGWVAGKLSKLFLEAQGWEERFRAPTDFSVSLAPR